MRDEPTESKEPAVFWLRVLKLNVYLVHPHYVHVNGTWRSFFEAFFQFTVPALAKLKEVYKVLNNNPGPPADPNCLDLIHSRVCLCVQAGFSPNTLPQI